MAGPPDTGTHERILRAAGRVFAQYGRAKASMRDVVAVGRLSRATVYKHFRTKEELFRAVVRHELADVMATSRAAAAEARGTRAKLRAAILAQLQAVQGKANVYGLTVKSLGEILPPDADEREELAAEARLIVREILSEGAEVGEIRLRDLNAATRAVAAAYEGLLLRAMIRADADESERLVDTLLEMLFQGILVRKEGG